MCEKVSCASQEPFAFLGVQVFHDILRNETFLKMLPMHVHIELAESNFMKAISEDDILKILRVRYCT